MCCHTATRRAGVRLYRLCAFVVPHVVFRAWVCCCCWLLGVLVLLQAGVAWVLAGADPLGAAVLAQWVGAAAAWAWGDGWADQAAWADQAGWGDLPAAAWVVGARRLPRHPLFLTKTTTSRRWVLCALWTQQLWGQVQLLLC